MSVDGGTVYLVGAGPGDPGLMTVRGLELLRRAEVIVHDRLIGHGLLRLARSDAEVIDVGKAPGRISIAQDQINALLVERARRNRVVVRLKGGDPFVFGRGFEELAACRRGGVHCVVVPGISSALAAPAAAGIPVTLRGVARSVAFVTAETAGNGGEPATHWNALAGIDTLVVLMGRARLRDAASALISAGRDGATPAACIEKATTRDQQIVKSTLAGIADAAAEAKLDAPMVLVVGEVADEALGATCSGDGVLAGKKIVVTSAASSSVGIERRLAAHGATVVRAPMIRIVYPRQGGKVDQAIEEFSEFDWIVFTSQHGVRGFWKRLAGQGCDSRALYGCRVAAVGPRTARELRRNGIHADIVAREHSAEGLLEEISDSRSRAGGRVLIPCGDLARATLTEGLRARGWQVESVPVYSTKESQVSEALLSELRAGVDSVLFFSPSAVRRAANLGLSFEHALIGCIGDTTMHAAQDAGYHVDVVPERFSADELVDALARRFALSGALA